MLKYLSRVSYKGVDRTQTSIESLLQRIIIMGNRGEEISTSINKTNEILLIVYVRKRQVDIH